MPRRAPAPTLTARPRRLLAGVMGLALGLCLGAGVFVVVLSAASALRSPVMLVGVPAGILVVAAMAIELAAAWRLVRSQGPVLTIGPEGLWDHRLSRAPIPWQALRWRRVTRSKKRAAMDTVRFDIDAGQIAHLHLAARLLAPVNRLAGLLPYSVNPVGIDAPTARIAEACARHKPPED
jgi:hypothetical protein